MNTDKKYIHNLLERYFDGKTNTSEDNELVEYFSRYDVEPEFETYKSYFVIGNAHNNKVTLPPDLDETIKSAITAAATRERRQRLTLTRTLLSIAASVILIVGIGIGLSYHNTTLTREKTYSPEEVAEMLQYVNEKINHATDLCYNSLNKENEKIEKSLKLVNKYIKFN